MEKDKIVYLTDEEKRIRSEIAKNIALEIQFPESVYSYIKGKSIKKAIEEIKVLINHYKYFIKIDIRSYFESINLSKLLKISRERLSSQLAYNIENILNYDKKKYLKKGLLAGSPLSNCLSNLYLIDFDEFIENMDEIKYYRFCDDILILFNYGLNREFIEKQLLKLDLYINEEKFFEGKTGDEVKFLGEIIKKEEKNHYFEPIFKVEEDTEDNFKDILLVFRKKDLTERSIKKVENYIEKNLTIEFKYLFRYHFEKEEKEFLIEEMIEKNLYKELYKFNELLEQIEEINSYKSFKELFLEEEGGYYKSFLDDKEKIEYFKLENVVIDEEIFNNHLNGKYTLAKSLNHEDKSKILVIDIDNKNNLKEAEELSNKIKEELYKRGIYSYIEFSGEKGYHLWIFFEKYVSIAILNNWIEEIIKFLNIDKENFEIRPKFNKISESEEIIKLPLGQHPRSRKQCNFIDIESIEEININSFNNNDTSIAEFWKKVDLDFSNLGEIAKKCSIVKGIIEYGIINKHISHSDRIILTYIFPKLKNGKEFIHLIMEQLEGYSYNITNKFIEKAPENPISCKKLKSYYNGKKISCIDCSFVRKGNYNTPILHCSDNKLLIESIKRDGQNLINDMIALKQKKNEIDREIKKINKKLNDIYNELGEEALETTMGVIKKEKDKWIIELGV